MKASNKTVKKPIKETRGRPRKYDYVGHKRIMSIRITDDERANVLKVFNSIQEFFQASYDKQFKK